MVFIVLEHTPARFLIGNATGVGRLGLEEDYVATGSARPVRVRNAQGTLQRGRTFTEAAASMAHEYGHVLGLPDLFNTDYLRQPEAPPSEDSAGIGAWGLMGWGTLGWGGDDGPNSFSAFSRERLGWSEVIEISGEPQTIRLTDVGEGGPIYRVPLRPREYFLLEYRRRGGNYYDRNIPGEGLLIWRVHWCRQQGTGRWLVSLECADGRWADAGYPLGTVPAPRQGGTNLDFWAHDQAYRTAHGGNLGDATDPFDGVRFTAFTPETNPAAYSVDGDLSALIENIRIVDGVVTAKVESKALHLTPDQLRLDDEDGDGIFVAGEALTLFVQVTNTGGLMAENVRVRLHTDDPWLTVERPEAQLGYLAPGRQSRARAPASGFPLVRLSPEATGVHRAVLFLDLYANDVLVDQYELELTGVSPRQPVRNWSVIDTLGNDDGQVQAGEFFHLELELEAEDPALLAPFTYALRPLHPQVLTIQPDEEVRFDLEQVPVRSVQSPEFMTLAGLAPGTGLDFEFTVASRFGVGHDTLRVPVAPGSPPSAPRVSTLWLQVSDRLVQFTFPETQYLSTGPVRAVHAVIRQSGDRQPLTMVPLAEQADGYQGNWQAPGAGVFLVQAAVEDLTGNVGYGPDQVISIGPDHWQSVELPGDGCRPVLSRIAYAPGHPEVIYGVDAQALWRSADGGDRWERSGLMHGERVQRIFVDAEDPLTVYINLTGTPPVAISRDGGGTWSHLDAPAPLLAVDPGQPGRLFATADPEVSAAPELWRSSDFGASWTPTGVHAASFVQIHPQRQELVYAGRPRRWIGRAFHPGFLAYSEDGGRTWTHRDLDRIFERIVIDAHRPGSLYALQQNTLWYSRDHGHLWVSRSLPTFNPHLLSYPGSSILMSWSSRGVWRRENDGPWTRLPLPSEALSDVILYPHPRDPDRLFIRPRISGIKPAADRLWHTRNPSDAWETVGIDQPHTAAGGLLFAPDGHLYAGTGYRDSAGAARLGIFRGENGGRHWEWHGASHAAVSVHAYFDRIPFFESLFQAASDPQFMLAQSTDGRFYQSRDQGRTWQSAALPTALRSRAAPAVLMADPFFARTYYIAGGGTGVWRSTDGADWTAIDTGLPGASSDPRSGTPHVDGFAADPTSPGLLYATIGDTLWQRPADSPEWVYHSHLGPRHRVRQLAFSPLAADRFYALTDHSLLLSRDRGQSWTPLSDIPIDSALAPQGSSRLRFHPHEPMTLLLITGPQLLQSRDGGRTWQEPAPAPAAAPWFIDVAVDPQHPRRLYASTAWGLYRLERDEPTGVADGDPAGPTAVTLDRNHPNPFNAATVIPYQLPYAAPVRVTVFNVLGQPVRTLVDQNQPAGVHQVIWDGTDDHGRPVASGVYFYRLSVADRIRTRRLALVR